MSSKNDPDDDAKRPRLPEDRRGKARQPRTLGEHLEIIDDALFESELRDESELDPADAERGKAVIRSAMKKAAERRNNRGGGLQRG